MEKNYPCLNLKNLLGCLIFSFLLLGYQPAKAQCFYIQSILVDACNGPPCPGTATEGQNEMFSFVVGNAALNVSNLTITWPNNPWRGIETNTTITTPLVNTLNSTIISCGWLKEPVGGVLPANATVLVITSTDMCTAGQSFASLTDTLYVIFQVAGNTAGHFVNYSSTPGIRTLTVSFSPPVGCSESVSYDRSLLIDQSGGHSAQDGAGVDYTPGGVATYINRGCQAPYIPITVSASAPASACSNATPIITGVITGPATTYSWTSNGTGTVSVPTGTLSGIGASSTTINSTYSPGAGESGTVTFTLTAHGKCSVSVVTNTVAIVISPAPSPTITSSNGASICNGGSTVLTASGSGTFTWNPGAHVGSTFTVSPVSTQIYSVAATNTCGTTNTTYTVTVNPSPTFTLASNSYTLCNGSSQTFTVSGANTYTWTPSATLTNVNTGNLTATPASTTVYSVTGTSAGGCTNATPATVTVTVNPKPSYTLTGNAYTICNGGSQTFTVSGASTYTWTPSATLTNANTGNPTASPTTTTVYSVTGTSALGCGNATPTTVTVTVSAIPTLSLTANSYTICNGSSQTFTASGASTYTWTPAATLTGANTANPTANPTTTTIYTVAGTAAGCAPSSPLTLTLTVNPLPTYSLTSNSYAICNGSSQTFTVSGASTYTWTPAATLTGANTANPTATPASTTVYSVTGTSASGCSNATPATVTVTVNPKPSYTLASNSYTICNGGSQTFTVSGANTYTWTPSATLTNANTGNPTATPTTTTVYSVTGTSILGCGNATPATVTVNITPVPSLSLAANSYSICNGGSQTFTVSGANTYTWTPAAVGLSGANTANPTANPATTTVYTVTGTASGCASSSPLTLTLTVNPLPTISVVPSNTAICSGGGSSTLTASGANTYTWVNAATLSSPNGSVVTAAPTISPTTYTVTGTDANNCVNKNTISIIVNPTPTVSVVGGGGNSQTVCGGGLVNATVAAITFTSNPSGSISWTNSNTNLGGPLSTPTGSTNIASYPAPTVTAQTVGVVTASSTVAGCTSTNSTQLHYTITINPVPRETGATINPAGCGLSDGTITGASGTGGSGNYSYEWNNTGGFVTSSSLTDSAGTYPLQIKDNVTGCIYSQNFTISNAGAPAPPAVTPSATAACVGGTVILTANPPAPAGTTYNWTEANGNTGSGNTYTVTNIPASPNPYTIGVTATAAGCKGVAGTTSITVNPLPNPAISSSTSQICQGSSTTLSVTPTGAYSYQWGNNSGILAGATSNTLSVTLANTYTVTITDNTTNCSASTISNGTITVNPLPTYSLTGNDYTICNGGSQILGVSGAITYTWMPSATLDNANIANPTASPTATTVYSVTGTDANACTNLTPAVVTVNVNPLPTYSLASNVYTICNGGSQMLTVSGATTYTWTPATTLDNGNIATPTASPTTTTIYSVTGTDANACTNLTPATVTVNVTAVPSLSLTANSYSICNGASQTFTASGASTYTWMPAATLDNPSIESPTANPTTTTIYTVTGTASGCAPSPALTLTLTVNPLPTYTLASNNYTICNGNTQMLTVSGASTYTWTPVSTLNNGNIATPTANPTTTTVYSVTGTDANACTNLTPTTVTVNVNPLPTYNLTGNVYTICVGGSQILGVSGASSFTWTPASTLDNANIANPTASPTTTTVYNVIGTDANACTNLTPATVTVNVNPLPTYSLTSNVYTICNGGSQPLMVSGANSYTWTPASTLDNGNIATPTANPTTTTIYSVIGTDANACTNLTPATVTVNVNAVPSLSLTANSYTICSGSSQMFTASGASTYTWTPATTLDNANIANPTASPAATAIYTVSGTNNGCVSTSLVTLTLTVNQTPTLNLAGASVDTAKCNQSNGGVSNINANNVSGGLAPYNYQWTNTSSGAIVSTSPTFTNQPNGTYSLQVTDANGCIATVTGSVSPTFSVPLLSVTASFITNPNPAVGTIPLAISFSNTSIGANAYNWSFGDGNVSVLPNPSNTYTNVGTYSVVLTAINGVCSNTYTITVIANIPTTIIIPNVFTPNGDGINDEFFIPNTGMASLTCDIYNRWGQLLYTINTPNQGWDGVTPNGDKAPEGTYMYLLEAKGLDGQTFKQQGTLMLVR